MDAVEELTATVPARWSQFGLTPVPMLIRILPQAQILILILCQNGTTDFSAIKKTKIAISILFEKIMNKSSDGKYLSDMH